MKGRSKTFFLTVDGDVRIETDRYKSLQYSHVNAYGDNSIWAETGELQIVGGAIVNHGTMMWTGNSDVSSTQSTFVNTTGATLIHDAARRRRRSANLRRRIH